MDVVVIPFRNEEKNIPLTLENIPSIYPIIMVDGAGDKASIDKSRYVAQSSHPMVAIVEQVGEGYGGAVLTGIKFALKMNVKPSDYIIVMDVQSHNFREMLVALHNYKGEADVIAGNRKVQHKSIFRKCLSKLARIFCLSPIHDSSSGFRAYKKHAAQSIVDRYTGRRIPSYAFNMAIALHPKIMDKTWCVKEFSMTYVGGKTGLNWKEIWKVFIWRIGCYR
jgi:glycosyltransferase involved in cell wall biosynthesis